MDRCVLIAFLNSREPERLPLLPCCVAALIRRLPVPADDRLPACAALRELEPVR